MPIVSPGGIVTPADSDGWDLTTDLATMATSIDSAVAAANAGANAFKGTASDRGLFTSTATPGMLWQDTDGIGMIWKRGVSGWVPAVWRWSGTTAQMNAFTQAPNGFEWFSLTDNNPYLRISGAWQLNIDPDLTQSGAVSGVANTFVPVTFPQAFGGTPSVVCQINSGAGAAVGATLLMTSLSTTGFSVRTTYTASIRWIAHGPR